MTQENSAAGNEALTVEDYDDIIDAVMETSRGRWFLGEYAKRNRSADTTELLEAISRLENAIPQNVPANVASSGDAAALRNAIHEMAGEINTAKLEIVSIGNESGEGGDIADVTAELDAVMDATENATSDILEAAEAVQEMAWTLREEEVADAYCDALDLRATEIYTACSFQDITGQRTQKVVRLLQRLDDRISTLAKLWDTPTGKAAAPGNVSTEDKKPDSHLLNGPALGNEGASQADVDMMMDKAAWSADNTAETAESLQAADPDAADDAKAFLEAEAAAEPETAILAETDDPLDGDAAQASADADSSDDQQPDDSHMSTETNDDEMSTGTAPVERIEGSTDVAVEDLSQKDMDALFA